MPDTTAKIRSKGLDNTGVTEDIARQMGSRLGSHHMAIVEFKVDSVAHNAEGKEQVALVLTQVEPAADEQLSDHLRELTRTMHYNRKLDEGQPMLPDSGGPNPKIADVVAQGKALQLTEQQVDELEARERAEAERDVDDEEDDEALDDDGGDTAEDLAAHGTSNVLTVPFGDGQDAGRRDDPITDPHTYVDTTTGLCAMCDQPAGHELHQAASA